MSRNSNAELIYENPVVLAIAIYCLTIIINDWLNTEWMRNVFDQIGMGFEATLAFINSITQPIFKDHPYYSIPLLVNPITPDDMAKIQPWLWVRGYFLGSVIVSSVLTLHLVEKIRASKVFVISLLIGMIMLGFVISPQVNGFDFPVIATLLKENITDFIVCIIVTFMGFYFSTVYSYYALRAVITPNYSDQPGVFIKLMSTDD